MPSTLRYTGHYTPPKMQWPVDPRSLELHPGPGAHAPVDPRSLMLLTPPGGTPGQQGLDFDNPYFMDKGLEQRVQPISTFLRLLQSLAR